MEKSEAYSPAATPTVDKSWSRREESMQGRREQVLSAAAKLLIDCPENFSMRNLARESGVSVRTIYNLVGERSEVLIAVVTRLAVGLHHQLPREETGTAFDGFLAEIGQTRKLHLSDQAGLAAIRALRLLGTSYVAQYVDSVMEADYLPDLRLAIEEGDLVDDVAAEQLATALGGMIAHAANCWSNDGDAEVYRERAARALTLTLMISATPANRKRCLALLGDGAPALSV